MFDRIRRKRLSTARIVVLLIAGFPWSAPPARAQDSPAQVGEWGDVMTWPNVPIHVSVLPNGKVLFWGRREWAFMNPDFPDEGLDPRDTTPRLWDPSTKAFTPLPKPGFNLFCSGHTFLADGRLLVVGGHIKDGEGEPRAALFNPATATWSPLPNMNAGRWYPTAVTLSDGQVLVSSGAVQGGMQNNPIQQLWNGTAWRNIVDFNGLPLYPRLFVLPNGRVLMAGTLKLTQTLDTSGNGDWSVVGDTVGPQREYGSAALYEPGKVLIVGGGLPPLRTAETIDMTQPTPRWQATGSMAIPRRHLNATILPDGTVLVTGGTSGTGGPGNGFNDLTTPVKAAELWDPATGQWTKLAAEAKPRMYHSTAVLLPDATVLSAGGGEYRPRPTDQENAHKDSQRNAQIFSPPYLFRGPRPDITSAPAEVTYGQNFDVGTSQPDKVSRVSWIRLSTVTHSLNMGQRINILPFDVDAGKLRVTAPANSQLCPPGHYMLFVLNDKKIPSVAKVIRIH